MTERPLAMERAAVLDEYFADLRVEAIDVNVRFSPDLLPDWEKLVTGVEGLVLSMTR